MRKKVRGRQLAQINAAALPVKVSPSYVGAFTQSSMDCEIHGRPIHMPFCRSEVSKKSCVFTYHPALRKPRTTLGSESHNNTGTWYMTLCRFKQMQNAAGPDEQLFGVP